MVPKPLQLLLLPSPLQEGEASDNSPAGNDMVHADGVHYKTRESYAQGPDGEVEEPIQPSPY